MTKTQNGCSGAPVMVPITIMSSLSLNSNSFESTNFILHTQMEDNERKDTYRLGGQKVKGKGTY